MHIDYREKWQQSTVKLVCVFHRVVEHIFFRLDKKMDSVKLRPECP